MIYLWFIIDLTPQAACYIAPKVSFVETFVISPKSSKEMMCLWLRLSVSATHFVETFLSFRGRSSCMESLMTFNAEFNSIFDVGINAGLFAQANLACISKNWIDLIKLLWAVMCVLTFAGLIWKPLSFSQKKYPDFDPRKFGLFDENIIVLYNKWTHLPFHSTITVFKWILTWKFFLNIPASSPSIVLEFFHRSVW